MSQSELPVSKEAQATLVRFFGELCVEVVLRFSVTPGELINAKFKKQHITPAREWVVSQLRRHIYRVGMGKKALLHIHIPDWLSEQHTWEEVPLPDDCKPIGFLTLARLLGFDHSALVAMNKRIAKREAREKRQADETKHPPQVSQGG